MNARNGLPGSMANSLPSLNYIFPLSHSSPRDIDKNTPGTISQSATHLGVVMNTDFDFKKHFTNIFTKFPQRVNLLCHMGRHPDASTVSLLYKLYKS